MPKIHVFGYRDRVFGYPYREGLSMPKQLIKYYCPNTLSQTPVFVKHPYTHIPKQGVCLLPLIGMFVKDCLYTAPKGRGRVEIPDTKHYIYKHLYSQIECLRKGLFG